MTEATLARARHLATLQRWEEVIGAVDPVLATEPDSGEANCLRAQALCALGRLKEGQAAAERALATDPDDEWAHRLLALTLVLGKRRQYPAALHHAEEAVRIAPWSVDSHYVLGRVQLETKGWYVADASAVRALEIAPHSALANELAGAVAEGKGDHARAEKHYREALRHEPDDGDSALALARVLREQDRIPEAQEVLLAAGRSDPTDERVRRELGGLGVPVIGGVGFFFVKFVVISAVGSTVDYFGGPGGVGILLAVLLLMAAAADVIPRWTRLSSLPDDVRPGLERDCRNHALVFVQVAALIAVALAVWSAAIGRPDGGLVLAASLVVGAAAAWWFATWHWRGPKSAIARTLRLP